MTHETDSSARAWTRCDASLPESTSAPQSPLRVQRGPGMRVGPVGTEVAHLQAMATRLREEAAQLRGEAQQTRDEWRQCHNHLTRLVAQIRQVEDALIETEARVRAASGAAPGRQELE